MRSLRIAVCSLALCAAAAAPAAAQQTGFEASGGATWTTFAQEQAYLAQLDAEQERLRVRQIGVTVQGRPIHVVQVDAERPRPLERVARRSSVLFVCTQHGDEPSGREACLIAMRELATTDDPELLAGLRDTTVLFIPTANPDGREADTRRNAAGVDINRDHLVYASPEGRAIGETVRDLNPDLVHDLHEYGPRPEVYDRQLLSLWPRHLEVFGEVHDLSVRLSEQYIRPGAEAAGLTTGVYGIWTLNGRPIAQVAGDEDPRILRNSAGLRHSLGLLVEASDAATTPEEAADVRVLNRRRVDTQLQTTQDTLRFFREHAREVRRATRRAPLLKALEGLEQESPVFFAGADNDLPDDEDVALPPAPCRYDLTAEQAAQVAGSFAVHGIRAVAGPEGGVSVPMDQAAEPVIPLLLDARSAHSPVDATAVVDCG
jgi:hypothetical protein